VVVVVVMIAVVVVAMIVVVVDVTIVVTTVAMTGLRTIAAANPLPSASKTSSTPISTANA
jgi:hypothetical protein